MLFLLMISNTPLLLKAQQVNSLYFMEDVPVRHFLNASFQPTTDFYLSLPIIGFTQFNVGNNSLTLKDVIYNKNGRTISFLDSLGNIPRFYHTLKSNTMIDLDFQTNLLSFGFRHESVYWTFSLTEKMEGKVNVPKTLFQISLFGTPNPENNSFDFTKLEGDVSLYTEAALGYSKQLNKKWLVGGKLKFLMGTANISNGNNRFVMEAGTEKWTLKGTGTANYAGPVQLKNVDNYQNFSYVTPSTASGWLSPSGIGAGFDIGFEYRLNKKIRLSGAINDIGFIHWTANAQNYQYGVDYTFNGIQALNSNTTINTFQDVYNRLILGNTLIDSISNAFKSSTSSKVTTGSYTTVTTAKINLGFEYSLLNDKINLGLLSYTRLFKYILIEEITGSVNARPNKWLNASLSYSLLNGRLSTIGAGLGVKSGIFHWFMAADYIPLEKATLSLSDLGVGNPQINIPIPYNSKRFNLSVGMNLVLDKKERANRGLHSSNRKKDCNCDWE